MRPCNCDKTEECRLCWLYHNDPLYRLHWDGDGEKCEDCHGNVTIKAPPLSAFQVSGTGHVG
jgi:hypothetical protein